MAFWDFLQDASSEKKAVKKGAKKVFKFLEGTGNSTVHQDLARQAQATQDPKVRAILQRGANAKPNTFNPAKSALDLGVDFARAVPREAASLGETAGEVLNRATGAPDVQPFDPKTNSLARFVLGSEPIKTLGERQAGAQEAVKKNPQVSGVAAPLSFLGVGLSSALNVTPFPKPNGKIVKKLADSTDINAVKNTLKGVVADHKIDEVAPAVALTKDQNVIHDIVSKANTNVPAPVSNFVRDYGDSLRQMETGLSGGNIQRTEDGFVRTSEHSPFFRSFYQEHGRAPTRNEWHEEGYRQLESGHADEYAQREYESLKNPETSSLLTQPEAYSAPDVAVGEAAPAAPAERLTSETGPTRERGFITSAKESDNVSPEAKKQLNKTPDYKQKLNTELSSKTKAYVDKDPQGAYRRIMDDWTDNTYDENVAIGIHLAQKAVKAGDTPQEVHLIENLAKQATEHGRASQAYAMLNRLSPEGILLHTQRKFIKAREAHKNFGKEEATAKEIQKQLAGVPRGKPEDAVQSIKGAIDDTLSGTKSTGEKLAKGVDKAASPVVKQRTDMLVKELTKKVKQEHLEPKAKIKSDPLKVLQEVFGRADEAKAAYPEAQQILREKYAGNERMSEALDKFFGSKLGDIPASGTTIDQAIKDQLKNKRVQVSKAIYRSWEGQKHTIADVTKSLVKEGFDEKSAGILAKEVMGRLNKDFASAKIKTLERMAKKAPEKQRATYIEKVEKLSNIGGLDANDYIDLARSKLGLPNLTNATAKQLSKMAQEIQTLPEGAEKYRAVRKIRQLIEENTPLTKKQKAAQAIGTPRALMASGDFSFGGRQALAYATAHPVRFAQAWKKQFKYFKEGFQGDDSHAFDELMGQIQTHKYYDELKKSPLAITDPFGINPGAREEQFIGSHFAEKIPGLGRLVRGSNYAFTGLANTLRANEFYAQLEHAEGAGLELTSKLRDDLAEVINTSTGRGNVKALEGHMKSLSTALFAPRLILSRVQMFNPQYYIKLKGPARKEALRQLVSLSAFGVGILTIADQIPGVDVGTNPVSSDFGKVKIGDTRIDFLGGYTQYIRLGAQLAEGKTVSSLTGRESQLGSGYGKKNRFDITTKFLENKENPVVSFITTMIKGQDAVGNDVQNPKGVSKEVISRFVPLIAQDVADMFTHEKGASPAVGAPLALFGAGVQTYGKQDIKLSDKQQQYVDALKSNGAGKKKIEATQNFYQTLKTTPDRNQASKDINKKLENQDFEGAQAIADKYNKTYAKVFTDWANKYSDQEDSVLLKEYNKGKLHLTSANIRTRMKNLQKNNLTSATLGGN